MKSEAILLSLEWRFSRGRFLTPRLFGYDKIEVPDGFGGKKKILAINENEARVVKWMYSTLLNGGSPEEIAEVLTELAIPTGGRRKDGTFNTHWTPNGVIAMMRNEKHCGDVLARKTYTPNYKDHKAKKNNGKKNKYFQPDHHEAIVSRSMWNAAQRILNSRKFGHEGTYLPIRIIDHGPLTGYISVNRTWAGFDYEDYYRASQIVMGLLGEELKTDLETEYLPEGGRRIGGLVDDHGIAQIARDLTAAEQAIKDELEGNAEKAEENAEREQTFNSFQVVRSDMFSTVSEPVIRITTKGITFNSSCVAKLRDVETVELLFNPVERMLVVRPCKAEHPNAMAWDPNYKSAAPLCRLFYDSMGWEQDYSFRLPCRTLSITSGNGRGDDTAPRTILIFDMDNYVGRAISKKEEVIIARKAAELASETREDAKSYYYPPDADEPQEIRDIEQKLEQIKETNKRIFGTPFPLHASNLRTLNSEGDDAEGDILAEAVPLDIAHTVDEAQLDDLMLEIMENPPTLPVNPSGQDERIEEEVHA